MAQSSDLVLDEGQLAAATVGERGEVWLLTWLSKAENALKTLPEHVVREQAAKVQDALIKITTQAPTTSAPAPKPARPVRALVGRCLDILLARTESRTLFDCIHLLSKAIADPKVDKDNKIASLYCAGHVMLSYGQQVTSQVADLVSGSLKALKQSNNAVAVRNAALVCIRNTLKSGGKALNDSMARDVSKTLRQTLSDKHAPLQCAAADAVLAYYEAGLASITTIDIEAILTICLKQFETANFEVRTTFARLLAAMLSSTQIEGSGAAAKASAKKKADSSKTKDGEKDEDPYPTITTSAQESTKTLMSLQSMLSMLSTAYLRSQTSKRARVGLIAVYAALFAALGSSFVESHYGEIAQHIIEKIGRGAHRPSSTTPQAALQLRYENLTHRRCASILLRQVIGVRLLSEQGQIAAIRSLSDLYLSKWPTLLPGHSPPSKPSLLIAAQETASLLLQLGCAPQTVQEALYEPLTSLLENPSYSVRAAAAWCLRAFCYVAPSRLASTTTLLLEHLNRDLTQLSENATAEIVSRTKGHAHALAALISVVPHRPLYSSFDTSARVMSLAIQLLKQSANHELNVSAVEIQVAWQLVTSLMTLGPNFVRLHLPQLLILWKNALPKSTSRDVSASQTRPEAEWTFLLLIREWALTSILNFLRHNDKLASDDTKKRLSQLLGNAIAFSVAFSTQFKSRLNEQTSATNSTLQLVDRDLFYRRRLYQCFSQMGAAPGLETHAEALIQSAVATLADPEVYTGSAVQAAIAASSGAFNSVWDTTDGFSFGVTSLLDDNGVHIGDWQSRKSWLNRDEVDLEIHSLVHQPVMGALEHDALTCSNVSTDVDEAAQVPPPATGVVDAAVEVFSWLLPSQSPECYTRILEQLATFTRSPKVERNPGRRMAILVNASVALVGVLRFSMASASKHAGDKIALPQVSKHMREIAKDAMLHSDSRLRTAGSEALGRLCHLAGTAFMTSQVQSCVTQVVSNTDPHGRAGCALALGQIYTHVGSLSAGPTLKTIFDVLLSLSSDSHPLVHFWALQSLAEVINAASLSYAFFSNATLSAITRLYMSDTHEPDGGSSTSVNLRSDLPAYQAFCNVLDALIGILGPDLQEDDRVKNLVLALLQEFKAEIDEGIQVEAIKATHHFLIFAPDAVDLPTLLLDLRRHLSSSRQTLKNAAINSVYQLVQRKASLMSKLGGDRFAEELFTILDEDPSVAGVRDAITSWLKQTVVSNPAGWIDLCQRIVSRTTASSQAAAAGVDPPANQSVGFTDEESQGLGLGATEVSRTSKSTSRWRTQLFALQCTHLVFTTLQESGRREHFDAHLSRQSPLPQRTLLIRRVSDLIKMAFTASTAPVMEIRLEGLVLLRDVIKSFSRTADLDFDGAPLLEQYQAPIAAALTPAFSSDSYPEVLSSAIQLCATFVSSGVVQEVSKMGRILKLLTSSLDSCQDADITSIGDFNNLTSTATSMLKISVFAAWAELQCATSTHAYLSSIVAPYKSALCPAWLASLKEYSRLRSDADTSHIGTTRTSGIQMFDSSFSGLSREAALPYFEQAWLPMLGAVGNLLRAEDSAMLLPLLREEDNKDKDSVYFFVLYGLAFDLLAAPSNTRRPSSEKAAATTSSMALEVLNCLLKRDIAKDSLIKSELFDELISLSLRLASTEPPLVQLRLVRLVGNLGREYNQELLAQATKHDEVASPLRLTQCLRVLTTTIQRFISRGLCMIDVSAVQQSTTLLDSAWSALLDLADVHPSESRDDIYAIALSLYSQVLANEAATPAFINATLPILKSLCERACNVESVQISEALEALLSQSVQHVESGEGKPQLLNRSKNNLLAAVLIISVLPPQARLSQASVSHVCKVVLDHSQKPGSELQLPALQCIRTLISATAKGGPVQLLCAAQIMPILSAQIFDNTAEQKLSGPCLVEFLRILTTFAMSFPQTKAATDVSVPVLVSYLDDSETKAAVTGELLSIASHSAVAFKSTIANLNSTQRANLEAAFRQSAGPSKQRVQDSNTQPTAAPSINLKSFAL